MSRADPDLLSLGGRKGGGEILRMLMKNYPQYQLANLASLATGNALGWGSPTLPKIMNEEEKIHLTQEEAVQLGSFIAFGGFLGPFIAGAVINRIGRKWTILSAMFIYLTSWFMLAFCTNVHWLYVARILTGFGCGIVFTTVPVYIAEISPIMLRGTLGSFFWFFLCAGFLLSCAMGPYISYVSLIIVCGAAPFLCISSFIWVPESPKYLLSKGREQKALDALQWYRNYSNEGNLIHTQMVNIVKSAGDDAKDNDKGSIMYDLFSNRGNLRALYYACSMMFFQQMSGFNVIMFYGGSLFRATGSGFLFSISDIFIASIMLVTATSVTILTKVCGIRKLLLFSAVGETACITALAYYFFLKDGNFDVSSLSWLPLTSLVGFIIAYSIGFGPFAAVIMAELFPTHLKGFASSLVMSFSGAMAFLVPNQIFRFCHHLLGKSFGLGVFGVFSLVAFFFVFFQLPNTEGKSFEQIQEMLQGKNSKLCDRKVRYVLRA